MKTKLKAVAVVLALGVVGAPLAWAAKKGIGVSCNKGSDCQSGYCKPNKAHLKGYTGTCQKK